MIPPPERKSCTRLSRFFSPSRNFHTLAPKTPARPRLTAGLSHRRHSSPLFLLPTAAHRKQPAPDGVYAFSFFFLNHTTDKTQSGAAAAGRTGADKAEFQPPHLPAALPSAARHHFPSVRTVRLESFHLHRPEETKGQRSEVSQIVLGPRGSRDGAANRDAAFSPEEKPKKGREETGGAGEE